MSVTAQLDEQTLSRRWKRAEQERVSLLRAAMRRGLARADAEDCVQEAMLRVVTRDDLDEARMGALLTTVTVHNAIAMHRRQAVARRAAAIVEREGACEDGPERAVCDREEARWSAALVAGLPETQRLVLAARADGVPVKQIAEQLSMSPQAVQSAIARARVAMRAAIASTLGAAIALGRRLRQPAAAYAIAATTVALLTSSMPFVHAPDARPAPPRARGDAVAPAAAAAGVVARGSGLPSAPSSSASPSGAPWRGGAGGGAGDGGVGDTGRETTAEVPTPAGTARIWQEEPEEPSLLVRTQRCVEYGYDLGVDDGSFVPQGRCRETPGPLVGP